MMMMMMMILQLFSKGLGWQAHGNPPQKKTMPPGLHLWRCHGFSTYPPRYVPCHFPLPELLEKSPKSIHTVELTATASETRPLFFEKCNIPTIRLSGGSTRCEIQGR